MTETLISDTVSTKPQRIATLAKQDSQRAFDHGHLRAFLKQRVRDGMLLRLIDKWLSAGVMEDGCVSYPEAGSPQGGVVSPILANVFLHYVLDEWFEREVQPRLRGRAFLIRYADDFVIGLTREDDAIRVMNVLPKRFKKYGLTVHPGKTRLIKFRSPSANEPQGESHDDHVGTFDLLGFTHYWGRSRKGNWIVKRKTSASRFTRAVRTMAQWCRLQRHDSITAQHHTLCQKLRGHNAYYGITGNSTSLSRFREEVKLVWRKWLRRRKRGDRGAWTWFNHVLARYPLPPPVAIHSVCRVRSERVT